jgi:seryl-tRNA synthetase
MFDLATKSWVHREFHRIARDIHEAWYRKYLQLEKDMAASKQEILDELEGFRALQVNIGEDITGLQTRVTELEDLVSSNAGLDEIAAKVREIKGEMQTLADRVPNTPPVEGGGGPGDEGELEESGPVGP